MVSDSEILDSKILIVDDHIENVELIKRVLERAGYSHLISTTDSREVVQLYESQKPEVVLLDIMMPYLDGFEVMEELIKLDPEDYVPVLVLTADHERDTRLKALKEGARDFLTKPIDKIEVLTRIRNILEVRLLHKRIRHQNEELENRVQARTQELQDSRLEILVRLARAAEFRDSDTGAHIYRMSQYSAALGRAAGLPPNEVELLLNASALHDVGKIGVADHLLRKPGAFDSSESESMKEHVHIGSQILAGSTSPLIQCAEVIARTHHERWDGAGYPAGLRGEEIPLVGRIVAISDVFDALTSNRPYKEPWSVDEALQQIQSQRGKHFAPDLVDTFLSIRQELVLIKDQCEREDRIESSAEPMQGSSASRFANRQFSS